MTFFKIWKIANTNSLGLTVDIHPTFDYSELINSERNTDETETGQINQSKLQGGAWSFDFPVDFVSSSDTSFIREQWRNQNTVRLTEVGSDNFQQFLNCKIINRNDPLSNYSQAQFNKFTGILNLVTVDDYNTNRGVKKDAQEGPLFILGTSDGILAINALG